MAAPTNEELQVLPKFRTRLQDLKLDGFLNTDLGLLQWLRARELNLDQSEEMLRKSLTWRKENGIDNILSWEPPAEFVPLCPIVFPGYDKENSPVCVVPFGRWNLRKLIQLGQRESYIKFMDQLFEKLLDKMKGKTAPSGLPVSQFTMVVDVEGLSMRTLACLGAIDVIMEGMRRFEANHPETLKSLTVVNASRVFTALFAIVRPILSQRTFGKIQIFSSNADKWKAALAQTIPRDVLPIKLGGSQRTLMDHQGGGEEANISASDSNNVDAYENYIHVTIPPGNKVPVEFEVKDPKTVLTWSFITEGFDIGFSLIHNLNELVEYAKVNSHEKEVQGSLTCEKPGTYIFLWDNSYSKVRGKVLKYNIEMKSPNSVE